MPSVDDMMNRQSALACLGEFAIHSDDLQHVLTEACGRAAAVLHTRRAAILEFQRAEQEVLVRAGTGWRPGVVGKLRMPIGDAMFVASGHDGHAPALGSSGLDEAPFGISAGGANVGLVGQADVPISVPGKSTWGVLHIEDDEPRQFTEDELIFLRACAAIVGSAIGRRELAAERRIARDQRIATQARQAFLLKLSDALRPVASASEIQHITTRLIGEHLGADRSMYAEVDGERGAERGHIRAQYVRAVPPGHPTLPPFPEQFRFDPFGEQTMAGRYRGETLVVCNVEEDPTFAEAARSAWRAAAVRAAIVAPLVKQGRLVAEFGVHSTTPRVWTAAEVSLIEEVAERTWAAAERARAEHALQQSEKKYRMLFQSMDEAYAVVEVLKDAEGRWADFRFLEVNPAFLHHTSMPEPTDKTATELLGAPNPRWAQLYGQALDTGRPLRIEETEQTLDRTFDLNIFALDRQQNVVAVLFTNITERKKAEHRQKVLLAELQHRVRNILAVLRSIIRRSDDGEQTREEYVDHLSGRIDALARTQVLLTRGAGASIDLEDLIRDELLAQAAPETRYQISGPPTELSPKAAEVLTLAFHELATNSTKYGALLHDGALLQVSWRRDVRDGETWISLDWVETGVDVDPGASSLRGFGAELICGRVPYDLGGSGTFDLTAGGLTSRIEFPLRPAPSMLQTGGTSTWPALTQASRRSG